MSRDACLKWWWQPLANWIYRIGPEGHQQRWWIAASTATPWARYNIDISLNRLRRDQTMASGRIYWSETDKTKIPQREKQHAKTQRENWFFKFQRPQHSINSIQTCFPGTALLGRDYYRISVYVWIRLNGNPTTFLCHLSHNSAKSIVPLGGNRHPKHNCRS